MPQSRKHSPCPLRPRTRGGLGHGPAGSRRDVGRPRPQARGHTLSSHTRQHLHLHRKHSLPPPRPSVVHSCAHSAPPLPAAPNAHTGSHTTAPTDSRPGRPLPRGPKDPCPQRPPTCSPSQALGTLLRPRAPSGPSSVGSPTPPLLPTDILQPPLISLEEQRSLPGRPHG